MKGIKKWIKVDILTFKVNSYYAQGFSEIVADKRYQVGKSDCEILNENYYPQNLVNGSSVKNGSPSCDPVLFKSIASKNSNLE